jgi:mycothiol synthase
MISYAWRPSFGPQEERELREMLAAAAAADAEPGFPAVSLDQPYGRGASHLVVRLLPDSRAGHQGSSPMAAYLRVEPDPDGGPATVRYVVRPEFRSRGISTLLLETLGLELGAAGGWAGTGAPALRVWARGDHPAAQRMAQRFERYGVQAARRQWQLTAPLRDRPGPEDLAPWYDPESGALAGYGAAGRMIGVSATPGRPEIRLGLVATAMTSTADRGPRSAVITIDAADQALARDCRLLGFRHDRTDIEYTVGGTSSADRATAAEVTRR